MYRVAIVGRPNVGKSALFNRLVGHRIAIVDPTSGVTRDRLYATVEWQGVQFQLIDTGGLVAHPDELEEHIARQVTCALDEADLILFAVDGQAGRTPSDDDVAGHLRATARPVWLVVTKADTEAWADAWADFAQYGWPDYYTVSALHGRGIGELLDALIAQAGESEPEAEEEHQVAIAVLGRPNAGKSSFVNRLVGEERAIVSEIPGTTRDAVDVLLRWTHTRGDREEEKLLLLIDTAGVRRKRSVKTTLEFYAGTRADAAVGRASVAVLLVDGTEGVTMIDKKIAATVHDAGRACVVGINKWDLLAGKTDQQALRQWVRQELPQIAYAPVLCVSAKTGENMDALVARACSAEEAARQKVSTGVLNRVLHEAFERTPPPIRKGRRLKLYYGTQTGIAPPRFTLFVNSKELVQSQYTNYVINQLRSAFGYEGTPVVLAWRARSAARRTRSR
jgi:GTP-binding protein